MNSGLVSSSELGNNIGDGNAIDANVLDDITLDAFTSDEKGKDALVSARGITNALIAVVIFSLTAPMTAIALKAFSPEMIATSRAVVAGICSLLLVIALRWRFPTKREFLGLVIGGAGGVIFFPYSISVALTEWNASNTGVVLAGIPLLTALLSAVLFRERHPWVFWLGVLSGTGLLLSFTWQVGDGIHPAIIFMVGSAAIAYAFGGQVAKTLGGWRTICWMTVIYLPVSALGFGYFAADVSSVITTLESNTWYSALGALLYLVFLSQWLGFHFWYDAMARVGIAKAGQMQLLQPFFTLIFAVPLLGASLSFQQVIYAALVSMAVVVCIRSK